MIFSFCIDSIIMISLPTKNMPHLLCSIFNKLKRTSILMSGERGIRTLGTVSQYTRFPGVPVQPLLHLSSIVYWLPKNEGCKLIKKCEKKTVLFTNFPSQTFIQIHFYFCGFQVLPQKEHQLGNCRFSSHILARNNSRI